MLFISLWEIMVIGICNSFKLVEALFWSLQENLLFVYVYVHNYLLKKKKVLEVSLRDGYNLAVVTSKSATVVCVSTGSLGHKTAGLPHISPKSQ